MDTKLLLSLGFIALLIVLILFLTSSLPPRIAEYWKKKQAKAEAAKRRRREFDRQRAAIIDRIASALKQFQREERGFAYLSIELSYGDINVGQFRDSSVGARRVPLFRIRVEELHPDRLSVTVRNYDRKVSLDVVGSGVDDESLVLLINALCEHLRVHYKKHYTD